MIDHSLRHSHRTQKAELGFWLYLMTDIILFSSLFATFMILRNNTAGGPSGAELFDPKFALIQTFILLTSSFTCGVAALAFRFKRTRLGMNLLVLTGVLGASFLSLELYEFSKMVNEGASWQVSAFLSAFFVLVGTHGLHILVGLIWLTALYLHIKQYGLTNSNSRKVTLFSLFWHFLDLIWVFLFAVVYLIGSIV